MVDLLTDDLMTASPDGTALKAGNPAGCPLV